MQHQTRIRQWQLSNHDQNNLSQYFILKIIFNHIMLWHRLNYFSPLYFVLKKQTQVQRIHLVNSHMKALSHLHLGKSPIHQVGLQRKHVNIWESQVFVCPQADRIYPISVSITDVSNRLLEQLVIQLIENILTHSSQRISKEKNKA